MPRQKKQNSNDDAVKDVQNMIKNAVSNKTKQTTKNQTYEKPVNKIKHVDSVIDQIEDLSERDQMNEDSSVMSDLRDNENIGDAFEDYDAKKSKKTKKTSKKQKSVKSNQHRGEDNINNNNQDNQENEEEENEENEGNGDEDIDYDELTEGAKKEYIQTVVLDKVINYIKLDDIIKQKQLEHKKEMKVIKDSKEQLEEFLIQYLDKVDEEFIELGNKSTLYKTEVKTKAAPKMEDIGICLVEGFKKYEFYEDDDEIKRVVKDFIDTIDAKREVKTRKYLKRKKGDADKNDKKANDKNNDNKNEVLNEVQKEQPKKKEVCDVKPKGRKFNK